MLLSDTAIRYALGVAEPPVGDLRPFPDGTMYRGLAIEPWDESRLNPASVDLTLAPVFRFFEPYGDSEIDLADLQAHHTRRVDVREGGLHFRQAGFEATWANGLLLAPGAFLLMATNEVVTLPHTLAARVEGKSSLGRLGLAVHITAGFIDPGFHGSITLEVANLNSVRPLRLRWGQPIAQIAFTPMVEAVSKPYGDVGHYQDQPAGEPVESRYRP